MVSVARRRSEQAVAELAAPRRGCCNSNFDDPVMNPLAGEVRSMRLTIMKTTCSRVHFIVLPSPNRRRSLQCTIRGGSNMTARPPRDCEEAQRRIIFRHPRPTVSEQNDPFDQIYLHSRFFGGKRERERENDAHGGSVLENPNKHTCRSPVTPVNAGPCYQLIDIAPSHEPRRLVLSKVFCWRWCRAGTDGFCTQLQMATSTTTIT